MYKLTLTIHDRRAIDYIGDRYGHGHKLYQLLWGQSSQTPDHEDWDADCDITFHVPEHVAWQILDIADECDYRWDCLAESLASKLTQFCHEVV